MTMDRPVPVEGVRLVTPAGWFDLDLDPVTGPGRRAKLVRRRVGGGRERAELRRQIQARLDDAAERAMASGARFASCYSEVFEGVQVAATLVGFVSRDIDHTALGDAVDRLRRADPGAEIELVDLPAGPAVRRLADVESPVEGSEHTKATVSVEYFVPMPEGGRTLLLAFSTPSLALRDALVELFDAIAGTLRWAGQEVT
jgi:hypothetical protein